MVLDVGTFDEFCGQSFVTFVTLHLLMESNFWTQYDNLLSTCSLDLLVQPIALVSYVTPYSCLSALALEYWIQILHTTAQCVLFAAR
jgi:hypothetical protein